MTQEEGLFESQPISAVDTFSAVGSTKPCQPSKSPGKLVKAVIPSVQYAASRTQNFYQVLCYICICKWCKMQSVVLYFWEKYNPGHWTTKNLIGVISPIDFLFISHPLEHMDLTSS